MKMSLVNQFASIHTKLRGTTVIKALALVSVVFLIGLGAGAYCHRRTAKLDEPGIAATVRANDGVLSDATQSVLWRLNAPLEIRFHSVLGESYAAESWQAFAGRVSHLLAEFERAGEGKVTVKRFSSYSKSDARAAAVADGVEPFNLDKREIGYLGIALSYRNQKICLPRLNSEWEQALEFDLGRAIARATGAAAIENLLVNPAPVDTTAAEEVLKALPDLAALSLSEATQRLRDASLEEFKSAVGEMQRQLAAARGTLSTSGEDPQIASKALQLFQGEQTEKLDQIPRRLQARITALERLKGLTAANSQSKTK